MGLLLEPTYPLITDVLVVELENALKARGIRYTMVKSPNYNYTLHLPGGDAKLMLRSFENWRRLIGMNVAFIGVDEIDTVKEEIATIAVQKLQGRLRSGNVRQMFYTTTPEGFGWAYKFFVEEDSDDKRYIKARTTDNIFLPQDFIDDLYALYPPEQIKAYLEGEFVNLNGNTVYHYFDREKHNLKPEYSKDDEILVGLDFNIGACCATIAVEDYDSGELFFIDEFEAYDTYAVGYELLRRYGDYRDIIIHPDASGKNRTTNASETDLEILRDKFGFIVSAPSANPKIQDRVNSVNNMFYHNRLFLDVEKCPKLARSLEKQAYDESGKPEKSDIHPASDDYNDSASYLVHRRYPVLRPSFRQYKTVA